MAVDWNIVGIAAGTAFCGLLAVLFFARPFLRGVSEARSLPRGVQSALAAFALVATLNADKLRSGGGARHGPPAAATLNDVARGYRLVSEARETGHSFAMPPDAAHVGCLHEHGGRSDFGMHVVDFGEWAFPCGTNGALRSRLWWFMDGRLQDAPRRPGFAASAGLGETLAVQGESRLWLRADGDGRTVTWERFFACGDTNRAVNAQISLRRDGGFTVRSNDLVRVYRRVNPDDWDDDGDPNDTDPNPLVHDGESFGPHQMLPEGANTNAYCWVDLVVPDANALVTFTGDGYSALPDPAFIARAGATNRVIVLIGKAYEVTSRMPIACVGRSSGEIEVERTSPTGLRIVWPVAIEVESGELRMENYNSPLSISRFPLSTLHSTLSPSFSMSVWPDCLGGGFAWTNGCCAVNSLGGGAFSYSCNDACHCGGCFAAGYYGYEGYRLPADGGWCGCEGEYDPPPEGEEDDGPHAPGASATFSKCAVIFEDGYWNTPTNWVERQSTQTELRCVAHGGPNGGHVRFEVSAGAEKLQRVLGHLLPVEQDVGPGMKLDFTITYEGLLPSVAEDDIIVTTTFTENAPDAEPVSSRARLTSVKVTLESTNFSLDECPNRHIRGIGEQMKCEWMPSVSGLSFQTQNGAVCFAAYDNRRDVTCPFQSASGICEISVGGATHTPDVEVLEPTGIEARNAHKLSYSVPPNSPGGAGFSMDLHIMPDTVSFQALEFWERPAYDSTIEGYFTNQAFQAVWYHNTNMGAGVWHKIGDANFWFNDGAQMGDELITPVCPGRLVWHIPVDWRRWCDPTLIHQDFKNVDQTFDMSGTGRLTVYKYQHWAAREMSGETFKSEGMTE